MYKIVIVSEEYELAEYIASYAAEAGCSPRSISRLNEPGEAFPVLAADSSALAVFSPRKAEEFFSGERSSFRCDSIIVTSSRSFEDARIALRCGAIDYFVLYEDSEKLKNFFRGHSASFINSARRGSIDRVNFSNAVLRIIFDRHVPPHVAETMVSAYGKRFDVSYMMLCTNKKMTIIFSGIEYIFLTTDLNGQFIYAIPEREMSKVSGKIEACCGASLPHTGFDSLQKAYDEAYTARKLAFLSNEKLVTFSNELISELSGSEPDISWQLDKAVQMFGVSKIDEIVALIDEVFLKIRQSRAFACDAEKVMPELIEKLRTQYDLADERLDGLEEYSNIWSFDNYSSYKASFTEWLSSYFHRFPKPGSELINYNKMRMAVEYIRKNYTGNLNMAIVSNYVEMNYSLFSCEFKKHTGKNFVFYLQELRINESKRMLENTESMVGEIGRAVGYPDEKHFMKVFKKLTGISPSEYRRNYHIQRRMD